jgi:ferrous iron transport protein A
MNHLPTIPIDMLRSGQWACVADVSGDPQWVSRMAELGLRNGSQIQMIRKGSPCLLKVGTCQLCLRADDSSQILVCPLEGENE